MSFHFLPNIIFNRSKYFENRMNRLSTAADNLETKISSMASNKDLSNLMKEAISLAKEAKTLRSKVSYTISSPLHHDESQKKVANVIESCFKKISLNKETCKYSQTYSNSGFSKSCFHWRFKQLSQALHEINTPKPSPFVTSSEPDALTQNEKTIPNTSSIVSRFKTEYQSCYDQIIKTTPTGLNQSDAIDHYLKLMKLSQDFENLLTDDIKNDPIFGLKKNEILQLLNINKELISLEAVPLEGSTLEKIRTLKAVSTKLNSLNEKLINWTPIKNKRTFSLFSNLSKSTQTIKHPLLPMVQGLQASTLKSLEREKKSYQQEIRTYLGSVETLSLEISERDRELVNTYLEIYDLHTETNGNQEIKIEIKTQLQALILQAKLQNHLDLLYSEINSDDFKPLPLAIKHKKIYEFQEKFEQYKNCCLGINLSFSDGNSAFLDPLKNLFSETAAKQADVTIKSQKINDLKEVYSKDLEKAKLLINKKKARLLSEKLQTLDPVFKASVEEIAKTDMNTLESKQESLLFSKLSSLTPLTIRSEIYEESKKVSKAWDLCIDNICKRCPSSSKNIIDLWKMAKHEGMLTQILTTLPKGKKGIDIATLKKDTHTMIADTFSKQLGRKLSFEDVQHLLFFARSIDSRTAHFLNAIIEELLSKIEDFNNSSENLEELDTLVKYVQTVIKNLSPQHTCLSDEDTVVFIQRLKDFQMKIEEVPLNAFKKAIDSLIKRKSLTSTQVKAVNLISTHQLSNPEVDGICDEDLEKCSSYDAITTLVVKRYQDRINQCFALYFA